MDGYVLDFNGCSPKYSCIEVLFWHYVGAILFEID